MSSYRRITASPAARHDDDVSMGDMVEVHRPQSCDQLSAAGKAVVRQGTTVSRDQLPEWFVKMVDRMETTEQDVQALIEALKKEGVSVQTDMQNVKNLYQEMSGIMQNAYDVVIGQGDIDRELNQTAIVRLIQSSNEFSSQVWNALGELATDAQEKQTANYQAVQQLNIRVQIINDYLQGFSNHQQGWNFGVEGWAATKNQADQQRDEQIRLLAHNEQEQQRRLLEYETERENEKKEIIDKVIQRVMDMTANNQPMDAQSLADAVQDEPQRRTVSPSIFQVAVDTNLPPSRNDTPPPAAGGNGGRGNGPPRRRVTIPPPEPSDDGQGRPGQPERPPRQKTREEREAEEDATRFLTSIIDKIQGPRDAPKRPKMPELKAPQFFSGKDKTLLRAWWMSVQDYVETYATSWPDEDAQVKWVGSLFTHKALAWHQERRKSIQKQKLKDTWAAFSSAFEARFEDKREAQKDVKRITELQYDGDIDDYITKLEDLNMRVGALGPMFRNVIWEAMTPAIKKMVYQRCGEVPNDDVALIHAVKEAAHVVEGLNEELGYTKKKTLEVRGERKDKGKEREAARPREVQQKDRKVKDKGSKKEFAGKKDRKSDKPAVYASGREALQGVPQAEIDKHKKEKADCWRCGRSGHKMYDCYAKKTVGGTELTKDGKVASSGKRKRDDDEIGEQEKPKEKKKAKTAAVRQDNEDMDMPDAQPRIWELEEDQNMESDF